MKKYKNVSVNYINYRDFKIFKKNNQFTVGSRDNCNFDDCTLENFGHCSEIKGVDWNKVKGNYLEYYEMRNGEQVNEYKYRQHLLRYETEDPICFTENEYIVPLVRFETVEKAKEFIDWVIEGSNEDVCIKHSDSEIKKVANELSNSRYYHNLQATKELMELIDILNNYAPLSCEQYIKIYDDNFYTYSTWEELFKSEQCTYEDLTEDELKTELGLSIWQLPCGWYVQYV